MRALAPYTLARSATCSTSRLSSGMVDSIKHERARRDRPQSSCKGRARTVPAQGLESGKPRVGTIMGLLGGLPTQITICEGIFTGGEHERLEAAREGERVLGRGRRPGPLRSRSR